MPYCTRCGKNVNALSKFLGLNLKAANGRCNACDQEAQQVLAHFRRSFLSYTEDDLLTPREWESLIAITHQGRVSLDEATQFIRGDALHFIERSLAFAFSDSQISRKEEEYIYSLFDALNIPPDLQG